MTELGGWAVKLNDVILTSGCDVFVQCADGEATVLDGLDATPDGLGLPPLRVEDVTYAQRDGVRHFNDWYQPRLVTLTGTIGPIGDDCETGDCTTAREQVNQLVQAWKRSPDDIELILYPPCYTGPDGFGEGPFGEGPFGDGNLDRNLIGPYAVVGRPRVATVNWLYRDQSVANFVLRFDSVDQRIYVTDACGTPGYQRCTDIEAGAETFCLVEADLCEPVCTTEEATGSTDPTTIVVGGTEVTYPAITLWPDLTNPIVENITTGDYISFNGTITGSPVIINTEDLTATQDGVSVTYLLAGSLTFPLSPGEFEIRLLSGLSGDTGYMTLCSRDALVSI